MKFYLIYSILVLGLVLRAGASITNTYAYPLGEAGSLGANYLPLETGGGAHHFTTAVGGTNAQALNTGVWAAGSTAYLRAGATGWAAPSLFNNLATDNFAFGVFARAPSIQPGGCDLLSLGDVAGAFKLSISSAGWCASAHNTNWIGPDGGVAGSFTSQRWAHLALIRQDGVSTFYVDGVARGSWTGTPTHGTALLAMGPDQNTFFNGDLDQAKILTFSGNTTTNEILTSLWGAATLSEQDPLITQTFPTAAGKRYIATFSLSPGAGETALPTFTLGVSGNALLVKQSLPTSLPAGGNQAPFRLAFTADSTQSTVRLTVTAAGAPVVSNLQVLPAMEPTPSLVPDAAKQGQIDRRYGMFIHYGINTFVNQQWTDGSVPVSSYAPTGLNVDQWVKSARDAGMRHIILTAKHHEGFCLWDSPWTAYDVGASPVTTDVVAAAAVACKKYGIGLGIYYSLWDRNCLFYQDDAAYNQYMLRHLAELLGNYGPICELWLDGGGNKADEHRWPNSELYDLMKRLQPDCLVSTNWGSYQSNQMSYFPSDFRTADPTMPSFPDSKVYSNQGNNYYMAYESTVTLSNKDFWFYDTSDDGPKQLATLANFYYTATAQDNIFILNAGPDRSGVIRDVELQRLMQLRDLLGLQPGMPLPKRVTGTFTGSADTTWNNQVANYGPQFALDGNPSTRWAGGPEGGTSATFEIDFGSVYTFDRLFIDEYDDGDGGRIRDFQLQRWTGSAWQTFHTGTTCGRFKLVDFALQTTSKLRLLVTQSTNSPSLYELQIFNSGHAFSAWRDSYFTSAATLPMAEMEADPDGDGLPNRLEFVLGSHPNKRNSLPAPITTAAAMMELSLPWNPQAPQSYGTVSYSLDLVHWFDATQPQHIGVSPMSSGNGQHTWQIDPRLQRNWFYRVR